MSLRSLRSCSTRVAPAACLVAFLLLPAHASAALVKGDLVVADASAFGGGALIEVNPETGAESVLSSNEMPINASHKLFARPYTLAVGASGQIYVANSSNLGGSCTSGCGGVIEVNPSTGAESVLASNEMAVNASSQYFRELTGIAVNAAGNIDVTSWNEELLEGDVLEVNSETGKETLISNNTMPINASSKDFAYPQGIVADAGGELFVADALAFGGHGGVIGVNPATGKESEVSGNNLLANASSQYFHAVSQLVFNQAGNLVVANWCPASKGCSSLIEVNPASGKEVLISNNEMAVNASSQLFNEITSVAVESSGRIVSVQENGLGGSCNSGAGCGGLVYVDPATGKETELSANSLPVNAGSELYADPFDVVEYDATPWPGPGPAAPTNEGPAGAGGSGNGGERAANGEFGSLRNGALQIDALRESRNRWREPLRGRRPAHSRHAPRGTVLAFTLSQPATVKLSFSLAHSGRSVGRACKVAARRNRRRCTYWRGVGSVTLNGHAGSNRVAFAGSLTPGRVLGAGRYRVGASATNAHGSAAAASPLYFTILR